MLDMRWPGAAAASWHRCCNQHSHTPLPANVLRQQHYTSRRIHKLQRAACKPCAEAHDGPSSSAHGLRETDFVELETFLQLYRQKTQGKEPQGPGEVFLVGTGPGDPGLLTLKAVQLMQTADVVLYDRLVSDDILQLVHPGARMIYVGKHSGFHTRSQQEIHQLLLAFAEAGALVIRLKGGDPYVFGRGGEEVQYLMAHGIHVHCVPGITAAAGICAELGIPMTHRGVATSVHFLTGHSREGGEEQLDQTVAVAANPHTTLVVYMGLATLPSLHQQLIGNGMDPCIPAVAIERGTTAKQRVVFAPLHQLPSTVQQAGLKSPTLIIVGEVVSLSPGWQAWDAAGRPTGCWGSQPKPSIQFGAAAVPAVSQTMAPCAPAAL